MFKLFVSNALPGTLLMGAEAPINLVKLSVEEAIRLLDAAEEVVSAVGHADTALVFSTQLGREIGFNRVSLPADLLSKKNRPRTQLLAGIYSGPRLPEGSRTLPEGAEIQWVLVAPMDVTAARWAVGNEEFEGCQA